MVVSDPENKKGVAGVKVPGPGQLVRKRCTEPGSVIQPRSPCSSQLPHPAPLSWATELGAEPEQSQSRATLLARPECC